METEPKKKGRGRPPKAIIDGEATPKKSKVTKRGRPKTDEEPALMGHVEPEQDYYYDSEDFNDEDDYAPTSKKSKNGDGDWKAAKSPKKSVRGGSSGRGRGRPKGSTNKPTSKSLAKSEGGPKRGRGRPKGSAGGVGRGKPKKAVEKKSTPKKAKAQIQDFSDVDSDEIQEVPESLDEGSEGLEDEDENLD